MCDVSSDFEPSPPSASFLAQPLPTDSDGDARASSPRPPNVPANDETASSRDAETPDGFSFLLQLITLQFSVNSVIMEITSFTYHVYFK